ncbi:MAG: hypothetical protein AB7O56_03430 [Bauldia sp.]
MSQPQDAVLHSEIRRLKELVERQFAELSALRLMMPPGDPPIVVDASPYRSRRKAIVPRPNPRTERLSDPAAWPTRRAPANPLWPNAGFASYAINRSKVRVIGFAVFGLGDADLDAVVRYVEDNQKRTADFIPLFLTDSTSIAIFRKRGYSYEYFPPHRGSRQNQAALEAYAKARLDLVQRKWGLAGIVTLGGSSLYPVGPVEEPVPALAARAAANR